jgi:hypothetical protein
MSDKYFLVGKVPKRATDIMEWARAFEQGDARRVAETNLPDGVWVSTVFLGIDHSWGGGPPLLFETMIFGGENSEYQDRCSTWEQAEAMHAKAVAIAKGEREPD